MSKQANQTAVAETIRSWTYGAGNPDAFFSIADRETGGTWHHWARGDLDIAPGVFERDREDIRAKGNPWTDDASLWDGSYGLFQLMAPYYTQIWSADAHPWVLHHPVSSTVVAARLWNRAIAKGAVTPIDVRMVWAYGPKGLNISHDDARYVQRVNSERERWQKLGIPGDPAEVDARSFGLAAFGTGPQADQNQRLAGIARYLGISTDPSEPPPEDWEVAEGATPDDPPVATRRGGGAGLAFGIAAFLGLGALLTKRKRKR